VVGGRVPAAPCQLLGHCSVCPARPLRRRSRRRVATWATDGWTPAPRSPRRGPCAVRRCCGRTGAVRTGEAAEHLEALATELEVLAILTAHVARGRRRAGETPGRAQASQEVADAKVVRPEVCPHWEMQWASSMATSCTLLRKSLERTRRTPAAPARLDELYRPHPDGLLASAALVVAKRRGEKRGRDPRATSARTWSSMSRPAATARASSPRARGGHLIRERFAPARGRDERTRRSRSSARGWPRAARGELAQPETAPADLAQRVRVKSGQLCCSIRRVNRSDASMGALSYKRSHRRCDAIVYV